MGLDLRLLPIFNEFYDNLGFSHSVIPLNRRSELFEAIIEMEEKVGIPVPKNFTSYLSRDDKYEEPHYGLTVEDAYGSPLKYVLVKDLLQFKSHKKVQDNYQNKAVWKYLEALPENIKIALYWS